MRSIGDKSLLFLERGLEACQQLVDCCGETTELISRIADVQPRRQALGSDALRLPVHRRYRRQALACEEVTTGRCQEHNERNSGEEIAPQATQSFIDDRERFRYRC